MGIDVLPVDLATDQEPIRSFQEPPLVNRTEAQDIFDGFPTHNVMSLTCHPLPMTASRQSLYR